jgi:hypothetical protein
MRGVLLVGSVLLAACGGRVAAPVAAVNSFDGQLSCSHLQAEYAANRQRVIDLVGEQGEKGQNNIGLLLVSPLFLDFSSTIKTELKAIQSRDERLAGLAGARGCPGLTAVSPPPAPSGR